MKARGYTMTSEDGNGTWVGFSKDMNGIWMSSHVYLETGMMDLHAGVLKMMCELIVNKFDFHHKRYDEYEKWAYFYGKVCSEIEHVVEEMDFIPQRVAMAAFAMRSEPGLLPQQAVEEPVPAPVKEKATLENRMKKFKKRIIEIGKEKQYSPKMCEQFFNYWSEVNDSGRKMRFEIAKSKGGVFNIERRLVTWAGKDVEYNSRFADRDEKRAKKQDEQLQVKETVKTKTLF